jgi:hypothetical protein
MNGEEIPERVREMREMRERRERVRVWNLRV